jgi:transcriptional antiterminator RfaH
MPILPREPDMFPSDLLEKERPAECAEGRWWVLHTLPRREKDLVRRLRSLDIWHYCPLIGRRSRSPAGRTRTAWVPLFGGYVFVFGREESRQRAMTTNCACRSLEVHDGERLAHDLRQIKRLIESGSPLTPEARIEPGRRVRIRSGSMMGIEGVVIRRRNCERLLVAIEFLQRGASIEIEDFQVEAIG